MGGSAEKRTRRKRAEAAGEARQRGETHSGKLKTKRNISSSTLFLNFCYVIQILMEFNTANQVYICKMYYLLFMWLF